MAAHQAVQNVTGTAECLIGFAAIALIQGLPKAGARLLGASEAIGGQRVAAASVWHVTRMEFEKNLELARIRLTEAEFQAEQAVGGAMSLEQAVDYALKIPHKPETSVASEEAQDRLTTREREVATLIGQGKTNGEIATELVLSKRTVESHVSKILSKLGLTNRGQIMRWTIERGLT